MVDIATNWEEISGKRDWRGLMDPLPLDTNLSKFITICGERVQAIYDSLNRTTALPLYAKENFFSEVGLVTDKPYQLYTVTNYLYVRSDVVSILDIFLRDLSAWIGYVAVATDEGKRVLGRRDILICWRGTTYLAEWAKNLESALGPATEIFGNRTENRLVHQGFLSTYISARELVRNAVRRQVDQYKDEEISITVAGHSLGAALATLNAADIVANGYNKPTGSHKVCMVTGFVFASPMVGDTNFTTVFNNQSNLHLLHIRHEKDPVPRLPGGIKYSQMGVTLSRYATDVTIWNLLPFIIPESLMIVKFHSLRNYLYAVPFKEGRARGPFESEVEVEKLEMAIISCLCQGIPARYILLNKVCVIWLHKHVHAEWISVMRINSSYI